jgi:uncharacterized protein (DUF488 family)
LKRTLFTIGYTGFSISDFIDFLSENQVECLVDTREIPISRKKGFSKTALSEHLAGAGIGYWHSRLLGSPKALRHEVRETKDYTRFFRLVHRHIETPEVTAELGVVIAKARRQRTCLMCCCPDWTLCHRRCLVEAISEITYFSVEHLQRETVVSRQKRAA